MTYDLRTRARRALLALTIVLTLGVAAASAAAQAAPPQAGAATAAATHATKTGRWTATIKDAQAAANALLKESGAVCVALSA